MCVSVGYVTWIGVVACNSAGQTAVFCDSCTVKVVHNSHVAMPCCCVLSDNTKILSVLWDTVLTVFQPWLCCKF